jgi:MOSC domain-containing protein YiiM
MTDLVNHHLADQSTIPPGRVFQINISQGGVPKLAVQEAVVTDLGLVGDRQRNQEVHGGPERAVCLYSLENILALQAEGHPVFPGAQGENLTLAGIGWNLCTPGARLQFGAQVLLEITRYTQPCNNLRPYFIAQDYSRVAHNQHPGWSRVYTRVLQGGKIQIGDPVVLLS